MNSELQPLAPGDFLTVPQVLAVLPVGKSTLYALIESGQLPHYRVSAAGSRRGRILLARSDVEALVRNARQEACQAPVRVDVDTVVRRIRTRSKGPARRPEEER